jgi:hypothetical protein
MRRRATRRWGEPLQPSNHSTGHYLEGNAATALAPPATEFDAAGVYLLRITAVLDGALRRAIPLFVHARPKDAVLAPRLIDEVIDLYLELSKAAVAALLAHGSLPYENSHNCNWPIFRH